MIPSRYVLPGLVIGFWDAWRLLGTRIDSGAGAGPLLLIFAAIAFPALRDPRAAARRVIPAAPLCATLLLYIAACLWGPALIRIAIATVTVCVALQLCSGARRPGAPFVGLVLLALPVLPSFEFYLAHPMRLASAWLTALLLRMHGLSVELEGVALRWGEQLVQFDAACSGVRMLWAALFLTSAIAHISHARTAAFARMIGAALALTIAANALRAASLFYLETGLVRVAWPDLAHQAVGIGAFVLLAAALATSASRMRAHG